MKPVPVIGAALGLAAMGLSLLSDQAYAQERSRVELSASYQAMLDASLSEPSMVRDTWAQGWSVDGAYRMTPRWSLAGSVDIAYGNESGPEFVSAWTDITSLAGVRFGPAQPGG
jgi:hypothetical protein